MLSTFCLLFLMACNANPPEQTSAEEPAPAPKVDVDGSPITVMGRVYDKETKQGLEGVRVITETGMTAQTNASGNYSIQFNWPADTEELKIRFNKTGYSEKNLQLPKGKTVLETLLSPTGD